MIKPHALRAFKTMMKARYIEPAAARRPSSVNAPSDVFNPARIHEWMSAIRRVRDTYIRKHNGRSPRLLRPRRFTEKIQWRKLFDLNPVYGVLSDKLAVRDFIAERVGGDVLTQLLWVGDDPDAVPFDTLDPPYVIKSTHASEQIMFVRQRVDVNASTAIPTLKAWLAEDYATRVDEPGYMAVPRRLIVERMVLGADGNPPMERKLYLFDGRVRFVQSLYRDETGLRHGAFHNPDWRPLDWYLKTPNQHELAPRPKRYADMVAIAECLGKGFDHLRVDFYDAHDSMWVGELTAYSWSGWSPFTPDEADILVGSFWSLPRPTWRALNAMLWQWRQIPAMQRVGERTSASPPNGRG
jgi:teichuronopeptide biosynthesis TupA-like protein